MNKFILGDMVIDKLQREIGIVAKPLPDELMTMEKATPSGRRRSEITLYKTDKLKKISIIKTHHGESTDSTVVMIIGADEYDLPFVLANIGFNFGKEDKIFTEFEAMPLIKDNESTRKYIEPFQKWREAIGKLPSEPVTEFGEPGEIWKSNLSPTEYLRYIPDDYSDEVMKLAEQFFDIFLNIYRQAEPVNDAERRTKLDAFRSEFNKRILDEDPSGIALIEAFGRKKAELFYEYLVYL